jgi:hypothetical protein
MRLDSAKELSDKLSQTFRQTFTNPTVSEKDRQDLNEYNALFVAELKKYITLQVGKTVAENTTLEFLRPRGGSNKSLSDRIHIHRGISIPLPALPEGDHEYICKELQKQGLEYIKGTKKLRGAIKQLQVYTERSDRIQSATNIVVEARIGTEPTVENIKTYFKVIDLYLSMAMWSHNILDSVVRSRKAQLDSDIQSIKPTRLNIGQDTI